MRSSVRSMFDARVRQIPSFAFAFSVSIGQLDLVNRQRDAHGLVYCIDIFPGFPKLLQKASNSSPSQVSPTETDSDSVSTS